MHEVSAQDILVRANEIVGEFGLTTHAMARKDDGTDTYQLHPGATSFCAVGAISRAAFDLGIGIIEGGHARQQAYLLFAAVAGLEKGEQITKWNDNASEEEVRGVFARCGRLAVNKKPIIWEIPVEETTPTTSDAVLVA